MSNIYCIFCLAGDEICRIYTCMYENYNGLLTGLFVCMIYAFVCVSLFVLCGNLLGKG